MTINSNGPIKFSDIQNEFGGSNPIKLSEYYNNSLTGYISNINNIPSSGKISIGNFKGVSKPSSYIWQFFNNSYCSGGEFALRSYPSKSNTTLNDIINIVLNTPSYISVYIYDGPEVTSGTWEVSYISSANTVTAMYSRYGSMTPYNPNNRYIYNNINKCTILGCYQNKSYAILS
jgi:hypothetical protein